ncbi:MAG: succinyl-diaminopimelate desuccinylase [Myxococcales bacterium]
MRSLRDRLAERTLELVAVPSETGHETALAHIVEARLADTVGGVVRHGNAILAGPPPDGRPTIALFGHLDTVPDRTAGPRRDEERIYGCGAADMKAGLAVMLALAEDLGPTPVRPLWVLYDREEGPYADNGLEPLFAAEGDALRRISLAFCMEPTLNAVQIGCLGAIHAQVHFRGRRAHSARPWEGENALHKAGPLLSELLALRPRDHRVGELLYREVMTATAAWHDGVRNVVPDSFTINVNYRFAPGKSLEEAQQDVLDRVAGRAEVEFVDLCPSGPACLDNPHLQRYLALSGAPVEPKQAWTDVARLGVYGVDAVNLGPGDPARAHQVDESTPIDPIVACYLSLARFLRGE